MKLQDQLKKSRGFDTWLAVGRTNLKVHRALNVLLGDLDLSIAQHEVLVTIARHPGLTQRELSERLLVIKSNATALLKKLESRGLVTRETDSSDSRARRLDLTPRGKALVRESFAVQDQVVRAMTSVMTDNEIEMTAAIMATLTRRPWP